MVPKPNETHHAAPEDRIEHRRIARARKEIRILRDDPRTVVRARIKIARHYRVMAHMVRGKAGIAQPVRPDCSRQPIVEPTAVSALLQYEIWEMWHGGG